MCPQSLINTSKDLTIYLTFFFIEFVADYDIVNLRKKWKKIHIIPYVHYNEHRDPKNYYKK
jgi:hypothetical protein